MTSSESYPMPAPRWNQWRIELVLLFALGIVFAFFAQQLVRSNLSPRTGSTPPASEHSGDLVDLTIPAPAFTPEEVVILQMDSMRAAVHEPHRLVDCYSLATPTNRAATGPFENFSELVRSDPYAELMLCKDYQVGTAVIDGNAAAVLVSLLTDQDQSMAFRFLLVKQMAPPYQSCWMTEGVFAMATQEVSQPESTVRQRPDGSASSVSDATGDSAPLREPRFD